MSLVHRMLTGLSERFNALFPSGTGNKVKIFFVVVALFAFVYFILTAITLLTESTQIQSATQVTSQVFTFPSFFFCSTDSGANVSGSTANLNPCPSTCANANCFVNGKIENAPAGATCIPRYDAGTATGTALAYLQQLEAFTGGKCLLFNLPEDQVISSSVTASAASQREVLFSVTVPTAVGTDDASYAFVGFFQQGMSPFTNGVPNFQMIRTGFALARTAIGLALTTYTDNTGFTFNTAKGGKLSAFYNPKAVSIYDATLNGTINSVPIWKSHIVLYVETNLVAATTIFNESFLTVWAALGGALSATIAIVYFFFRNNTTAGEVETQSFMTLRFVESSAADKDNAVSPAASNGNPGRPVKATNFGFGLSLSD